jgi:hypothetical protein
MNRSGGTAITAPAGNRTGRFREWATRIAVGKREGLAALRWASMGIAASDHQPDPIFARTADAHRFARHRVVMCGCSCSANGPSCSAGGGFPATGNPFFRQLTSDTFIVGLLSLYLALRAMIVGS